MCRKRFLGGAKITAPCSSVEGLKEIKRGDGSRTEGERERERERDKYKPGGSYLEGPLRSHLQSAPGHHPQPVCTEHTTS